MSTQYVLNPPAGSFSVFAWVKGGAPGQVILSQDKGMDWLLVEPGTGCLMAGLKSDSRLGRVLRSQTAVTDADWRRVGLVWDDSNRRLYVDDVLVAEDTQEGLAACYGGLQIGCGKDMALRSFWSGLIDDVCIYNRAVQP